MSIHPGITLNLHESAEYLKKSLILALITIFGAFIALFIALGVGSIGFIVIVGLLLLGAAIGLIVFQILQLSRLSRAKVTSQNNLLTQAYNMLLGALIASGISIFTSNAPMVEFILGIVGTILTILGYKALVEFAERNYSSAQKARQGFNLFSISSIINIGLSLVSFLITSYDTALLILGVSLIVSIVAIVGQFMLANGFLEVFSEGQSFQSPSSSWNDPTEPTFQSYGAPSTPSPPSSSTYHPPASSTEKNFCKMCGTQLMDAAKFCGHCGSTQ
jgi:small-conductance mechanosensitive channel